MEDNFDNGDSWKKDDVFERLVQALEKEIWITPGPARKMLQKLGMKKSFYFSEKLTKVSSLPDVL